MKKVVTYTIGIRERNRGYRKATVRSASLAEVKKWCMALLPVFTYVEIAWDRGRHRLSYEVGGTCLQKAPLGKVLEGY